MSLLLALAFIQTINIMVAGCIFFNQRTVAPASSQLDVRNEIALKNGLERIFCKYGERSNYQNAILHELLAAESEVNIESSSMLILDKPFAQNTGENLPKQCPEERGFRPHRLKG
jgi:hypothetical protein